MKQQDQQEKRQSGIGEDRQAAGESAENKENMQAGLDQEDTPHTDETAQKYYARILTEYQKAGQKGFAGNYGEFSYVNPNLINSGSRELYYTLENMSEDGIPEELSTVYLSLTAGTAKLNYERQILYSNGIYTDGSSGGLAADEITEAEYEQLLKDMEDQYPVKTDMEWKKIQDLSIGAQEETGNLLTFEATQQQNSRPGKRTAAEDPDYFRKRSGGNGRSERLSLFRRSVPLYCV